MIWINLLQDIRVAHDAATILQMVKRMAVKFESLAWQSTCRGSEERRVLNHAVEGHESELIDKSSSGNLRGRTINLV